MLERLGGGRFSSPIAKYYAYAATTRVSFTAAVWILFVRAQGLSYTEIGVLNALWWVTLVVSEIPTGYLGDRLGRRNGMLLGTGVVAVATAALGLSTTFREFAVVYALWAVGQTFRSGSDDAWLYDVLAREERAHEFAAVRGKAAALGFGIGAVTAPVGGALADWRFSVPFFATAAVTALGVPILLTVPEVDAGGDRFTVRDASRVIRRHLSRPPLRSFVLYVALVFGLGEMVYVFDQPIVAAVAADLGVPASAEKTAVGLAYGVFTVGTAVASFHTDAIRERLGLRGWFALAPLVLGLSYVGLWAVPLLAGPVFLLARGVAVVSLTLGNQHVNDEVESVGRATVLSAASMVYWLTVAPVELLGGVVADAVSPAGALAVFGVLVLCCTGALWVLERPV
ncbi:MFS transporter [Halogeometricum limi]|uniref:Major Facilitator Superfamily protein n=1 Tax=Halogeometricum limi TaxID=555875 RepID=A0A1I6HIP7_9EURY|nr:MFS transporter [Halogeometricum limi]SFR54339.1 Major Facilitator Superfamily protein [Halogeometricum limi]